MSDILVFLKQLINKSSGNQLFKRNVVKQYLQIMILDYLYSHPKYSQLVFYGGSCLAHCYGLPRLSEDLDFIDLDSDIELEQLANDLYKELSKNTGFNITFNVLKFRIYLKISLLHKLGLSKVTETDQLYLKVEICNKFNYCSKYKIDIIPLFKYNYSILIKTLDLPTLMATKINAVLNRIWVKSDKTGKILAEFKGRDYFDLMWYLEKGIKPNLECIDNISGIKELKKKLLTNIERLDSQSIRYDLELFIDNPKYVSQLSMNLKEILTRQIIQL